MEDEFSQVRERLVPQGTSPVVRLFLESSYFDETFVKDCINEMERQALYQIILGEFTPLQKLGAQVLLNSAYINLKKEK